MTNEQNAIIYKNIINRLSLTNNDKNALINLFDMMLVSMQPSVYCSYDARFVSQEFTILPTDPYVETFPDIKRENAKLNDIFITDKGIFQIGNIYTDNDNGIYVYLIRMANTKPILPIVSGKVYSTTSKDVIDRFFNIYPVNLDILKPEITDIKSFTAGDILIAPSGIYYAHGISTDSITFIRIFEIPVVG